MRAIEVTEHGGPDVLREVDLPQPEPGPGDLLVEVAAAGVNFIDVYQREGRYPVPTPFVLGMEGAGTVTAVGEGVTCAAVGTASPGRRRRAPTPHRRSSPRTAPLRCRPPSTTGRRPRSRCRA